MRDNSGLDSAPITPPPHTSFSRSPMFCHFREYLSGKGEGRRQRICSTIFRHCSFIYLFIYLFISLSFGPFKLCPCFVVINYVCHNQLR